MKLPDPNQFVYRDCNIAGDDCILIIPNDMGTDWNDENARFRSIIVRKHDNFVVSQGFGKFTNFAEKPQFQPWNNDWPVIARHKLDGSLLIVSRYKGHVIARTRGTVDASTLPNGSEIELLKQKYPKCFNDEAFGLPATSPCSYLYEWTTPNNVIVLREHAEPTLTLLGIVCNKTGEYASQRFVDAEAKQLGVGRPREYQYDSIAQAIEDVDAWIGSEGIVLYDPTGQILKKIKASEYLRLHRLKSKLSSMRALIDVFIEAGKPEKYEDLFEYIERTLDHEIATNCHENIKTLIAANRDFLDQAEKVKQLVVRIWNFSRKEQALDIVSHYKDWRAGYAFNLLDKKPFEDRKLAEILENKASQMAQNTGSKMP